MLGRSPATVGLQRARLLAGVRNTPGDISVSKEDQQNLLTPKVEEAPSDLRARWQRQSASSSEHQRLVPPRPVDTPQTGLIPHTGPSHRLPLREGAFGACAPAAHSRARNDVRETTYRRRQRLQSNQRREDDAEIAEREAAAALTRAELVTEQHARAGDSVAAVTSSSGVRVQHVHSRSVRLGDAFLDGNISFMASAERDEFSAELRTAVVQKASALLTSVRRSSFHSP